ncbi:TIGR04197 family type VII secretion effector [Streptococcus suis]
MTEVIKSDKTVANAAVQELVGIDIGMITRQELTLNYTSDITGVENALQTSNNILQAISEFSQAVLVQAIKFPHIAAKLEKIDIEESRRWNK